MSNDESNKGAKRRSGIPLPTTSRPIVEIRPVINVVEDAGKDSGLSSGLSSESATPTNLSPQPQIRRTKMSDIIAASKARLQKSEIISRCDLLY